MARNWNNPRHGVHDFTQFTQESLDDYAYQESRKNFAHPDFKKPRSYFTTRTEKSGRSSGKQVHAKIVNPIREVSKSETEQLLDEFSKEFKKKDLKKAIPILGKYYGTGAFKHISDIGKYSNPELRKMYEQTHMKAFRFKDVIFDSVSRLVEHPNQESVPFIPLRERYKNHRGQLLKRIRYQKVFREGYYAFHWDRNKVYTIYINLKYYFYIRMNKSLSRELHFYNVKSLLEDWEDINDQKISYITAKGKDITDKLNAVPRDDYWASHKWFLSQNNNTPWTQRMYEKVRRLVPFFENDAEFCILKSCRESEELKYQIKQLMLEKPDEYIDDEHLRIRKKWRDLVEKLFYRQREEWIDETVTKVLYDTIRVPHVPEYRGDNKKFDYIENRRVETLKTGKQIRKIINPLKEGPKRHFISQQKVKIDHTSPEFKQALKEKEERLKQELEIALKEEEEKKLLKEEQEKYHIDIDLSSFNSYIDSLPDPPVPPNIFDEIYLASLANVGKPAHVQIQAMDDFLKTRLGHIKWLHGAKCYLMPIDDNNWFWKNWSGIYHNSSARIKHLLDKVETNDDLKAFLIEYAKP